MKQLPRCEVWEEAKSVHQDTDTKEKGDSNTCTLFTQNPTGPLSLYHASTSETQSLYLC